MLSLPSFTSPRVASRFRILIAICLRCARAARFASERRKWLATATMLLVMLGVANRAGGAVIHVTSLEDKIAPMGSGGCSLPEAIYSPDLHTTIDGVHGLAIDSTNPDHFITTECEAGDGDDTISLPMGGVFQMAKIVDDAYNFMGPAATPIIFSKITIEGFGARLQWVGSGHARLFAVGGALVNVLGTRVGGIGDLTIRNVYVKGFSAKGGDGGGGGGGGIG